MINMRFIFFVSFLFVASLFMPGCSPHTAKAPTPQDTTQAGLITLNPDAVKQTGITSTVVETRTANTPVLTTGEIKADANQVFQVHALSIGRITSDRVILGDHVHAGQVLATLQNTDVIKVYGDYLHEAHLNAVNIRQNQTRLALAKKTLAREKALYQEGISPRKDYLQAQTDATLAKTAFEGEKEHHIHIQSEAKALLGAYGVRLNPHSEEVQSQSPLIAPRGGIITQKNITLGAVAGPEQTLYEISNLSNVWLDIVVYDKDLRQIQKGEAVTFLCDGLPGQSVTGVITYLQPSANTGNRTYVARAVLSNLNLTLRPGMLGKVTLHSRQQFTKPFIPNAALQTIGKEHLVFKDLGHGHFKEQPIELGRKVTGGYLVNRGLQPGDRIVIQGAFNLKAELLKSQFGED